MLLQLQKKTDIIIDYQQTRMCPKCDNRKMLKHFVSTNMEVEVDECPECGGFWLDSGELRQIREQFETDAERTDIAKKYFAEVFKNDMKQSEAETEETLKHIRKITRMFRFICPSYYIPGKQKWGAF
jgi:Zn-finger nucleic acid-binding protein